MNTFQKSKNFRLEISGLTDQDNFMFPVTKITMPLPHLDNYPGSRSVRNVNFGIFKIVNLIGNNSNISHIKKDLQILTYEDEINPNILKNLYVKDRIPHTTKSIATKMINHPVNEYVFKIHIL